MQNLIHSHSGSTHSESIYNIHICLIALSINNTKMKEPSSVRFMNSSNLVVDQEGVQIRYIF